MFAGAAPQVLTFAALTRNFDIQSEIEVKDNLDNKPDNEEIEDFSKDDFPTLFAQLLKEIKEEVKSGKIVLPLQTNFYVDGESHKSEFIGGGSAGGGGMSSTVSNKNLSSLIQNAVNQKFQPKAFELSDYGGGKSKKAAIRIQADSKNLSLVISLSKADASQFAEFLNREFSSRATSIETALIKQIYENSSVAFENNQVFIHTHLPRGSLDEYLNEREGGK